MNIYSRFNVLPKSLLSACFSTVPIYGGVSKLVNLMVPSKEILHSGPSVSLPLGWRQRCDMELLVNGSLTPLDQYMDRAVYQSVCEKAELPNGLMFPIPFVLEIPRSLEKEVHLNRFVNLTDDRDGSKLATVEITDLWEPDFDAEVAMYGGDVEHPEIERINRKLKGNYLYAGAKFIQCWQTQKWSDFNKYRQTPEQVRGILGEKGWNRTVAFQTRNPMHYAHIELVKRAAKEHDCNVLLNPVSGPTKDGDIDYKTRMKAYQAVISSFDQERTMLNLLPLAMRMGGPREALLHCIIRQNYGASHFIIGRDHAGPGSNSKGVDFYEPYAARDAASKMASKFQIQPIPFDMVVYVEEDKKYYLASEVPKGIKALKLSGTEVRKRLREGTDIPEWFSPPDVVKILRKKYEQDKWMEVNKELQTQSPMQVLKHALETFGNDVAISFSGAEDVILIEYAKQLGLPFRVFSLETGRLHHETYKLFDDVEKHYNIKIEYCVPEGVELQKLVREKGLFSFYKDGHNECCNIRKVTPLRKQLSGMKAWITGMRKDQSVTRVDVPAVLIDQMFKGKDGTSLIKYNPLNSTSSSDVWWDIQHFNVPFNALHQQGYLSIGCQPCTRVTLPSQHEREGRWWWEEATQKECGLHAKKHQKQE